MHLFRHSRRARKRGATAWLSCIALGASLAGCANPGPPRPPSLKLPEPVTGLAVRRSGDTVELRFTAPSRTTDKLPLRGPSLNGVLCRQLERQPCARVGAVMQVPVTPVHSTVLWHDALPPELTRGAPQLLGYRVEFFSASGRSAGASDAAYTVSGGAPPPVEALRVEGSRLGTLLLWKAAAEEKDTQVLVRRQQLQPAPDEHSAQRGEDPGVLWLAANATQAAPETLDTTALPGVTYAYTAVRRTQVTLGGRTLELRSAESAPVTFTLQQIYPPPVPTGLTVAAFAGPTPAPASFAVDLIWQPVDEAGLITPLAGYNVYRQTADAAGNASTREKLNAKPVPLPGFHDPTARPSTAYRYSVTAVDIKGNESQAATSLLDPVAQ